MKRSQWFISIAVALLTACGAQDERPDPAQVGGKADVPSWLVHKPNANWGCRQTVEDKFDGLDSAHLYSFPGRAGVSYTFDFDGSHDGYRGAVIAVYDAETGDRIAYQSRYDADVSLKFTADKDVKLLVAAYSKWWSATGDYKFKATCHIPGLTTFGKGDTTFENLERRHSFGPFGPRVALENGTNKSAAPSGRAGNVEEADIYRVADNQLFYLNTYRGFMIYDLDNPAEPKQVARLPIYGYPVEMFVDQDKGLVVALIRDVLYLTRKDTLSFERRNVSQVVTIDISNPQSPQLLQRFDVLGQLKEGVSRKIGDTVYLVSSMPRYYFWGWRYEQPEEPTEQAWVYSFNVADPQNVALVEKLQIFEGKDVDENEDGNTRRYFNDVRISATANALMVVENWNVYGHVNNGPSCGSSRSLQEAKVSVVDISDPTGKISLHTKFDTYGRLGDQFKQTYRFDQASGKGHYFGIFNRREWISSGCTGQSTVENVIESWDITDGQNPQRVDALKFGKPNEDVRGSVFDLNRDVAFAITARRIDPLYAISLADPTNLKVLSEIDGLSGDMSVFRSIAQGQFLIGIGRDNSETCTGFGAPAGWNNNNIAASIIDVQDLNNIRLVQRKCVEVDGARWVGSNVTWNLDQAHKLIGMHSDGIKNVISIPVHYSVKQDGQFGWWRHESAVALMSWDLGAYDPAKSETEQDVLKTHETIVHENGSVRRSVLFSHQGQTVRRKLLNLSDTHFSVVDVQDLDAPTTDAVVEIAPYYHSVLRFGSYMVERISLGNRFGSGSASQFRVKPVSADLESAEEVTSFTVANVDQSLKIGDNLVLLRRNHDQLTGDTTVDAVVYDLSNPQTPTLAATVALPMTYLPYWRPYYGSRIPFGFSGESSVLATDNTLFILFSQYDFNLQSSKQQLIALSVDNATSPQLTTVELDSKRTYLGLTKAPNSDKAVFVASKETVGQQTVASFEMDRVKYRAQRYSVQTGNLAATGSEISLPGQLAAITTKWGQSIWLTKDNDYQLGAGDTLHASDRLHVLRSSYYGAELRDSKTFDNQRLQDLVLDGFTLYVNAQAQYSYGPIFPLASLTIAPRGQKTGKDELHIFDLSYVDFYSLFSQETSTESMSIEGVEQDRLFLRLGGDGLLILDVSQPSSPAGQHFVRTLGWGSSVAFAGDTAYVVSGHYGVQSIDLGGASTIQAAN